MNGKALLEVLLDKKSITIKGTKKEIIGMARYTTTNNPSDEYIKVAFTDESGMYFPLVESTTVFYYEKKLGEIEEISDESIKNSEPVLVWDDRRFHSVNTLDYQYVVERYIGNLHRIEGEVLFSDYEDEKGNVLSLGWNSFEKKRDDVYAEPLIDSEWSI